jgi:type I restriction enzyme S subunit
LDKAHALRAKRRNALGQLNGLPQAVFLEMFGEPTTNPKGFPRRVLGDLIEFVGGSQPPRETFTFEPSPDSVRLVQIRDFRTDAFKTYIPRRLSKRFFDIDDVMIGRYGPPLFQILRGLSGSYNVALIKAMPKTGVSKNFIYHLLQEERLHSYVVARSERTAGQTSVNLALLQEYPVFLPPEDLQQRFVSRMQLVDRVASVQAESLRHFNAVFASLQHQAFAGEL